MQQAFFTVTARTEKAARKLRLWYPHHAMRGEEIKVT